MVQRWALPYVLEGIKDLGAAESLLDASTHEGLLITLRLVWVYAVTWIAFGIRRLMRRAAERPPANESFVIG